MLSKKNNKQFWLLILMSWPVFLCNNWPFLCLQILRSLQLSFWCWDFINNLQLCMIILYETLILKTIWPWKLYGHLDLVWKTNCKLYQYKKIKKLNKLFTQFIISNLLRCFIFLTNGSLYHFLSFLFYQNPITSLEERRKKNVSLMLKC